MGEGLSIPHLATGSWHRKKLSAASHYLKYFPVRSTPRIFPAEAQNSVKYTKVSEAFSTDTANYFSTGQLYILNYLQIIKKYKKILNTQTVHYIYKSHRAEMQITLYYKYLGN